MDDVHDRGYPETNAGSSSTVQGDKLTLIKQTSITGHERTCVFRLAVFAARM